MEIFVYIIVFLISYIEVEIFRRWSLRRELFDVPNKRSSHTTPTVRGGGVVFVVICLLVYTYYTSFVTRDFQWSYLLGAALIALISWLDDVYSISSVWRFLVHTAAALLIVFNLGYFQVIYIPFFSSVEISVGGAIITLLGIVWLTNAFNFMDGIDGIAGLQAVIAGIGWLLVGKILGFPSTGFYGGIIAFSSLGFLIQNWQPAKIFMGDVGSAFLGYSFAVLPLLAKNEIGESAGEYQYLSVIAIVMVWLFIFDTIITFANRILRRERVWEAHREHIYQRLVIAGFSHRAVTILYGSISILTITGMIFWLIKKSKFEALGQILY